MPERRRVNMCLIGTLARPTRWLQGTDTMTL